LYDSSESIFIFSCNLQRRTLMPEQLPEIRGGLMARVHERAKFFVVCGTIGSLGVVGGCAEADNTRPPSGGIAVPSLDRDNDGIINLQDRYPDIADPVDADFDGVPNIEDLLYPYDATNGGVVVVPPAIPIPTPTPQTPNTTTLACAPGYGPDNDGDGKPDHCDPVIGDLDSDRDGLLDRDDASPYNSDRDNDGIPDGQDSDPNTNRNREDDRLERDRLERERLERERQERQQEEDRQRDRDPYN
jgi:hypothetical protein